MLLFVKVTNLFLIDSVVPKKEEEEAQPVKKTYTWNTKEEAKQAFKELLKEKVFILSQLFFKFQELQI